MRFGIGISGEQDYETLHRERSFPVSFALAG